MQTLKLAMRNIFRNTRRSVLTIMLIGFSLSALILTDAITRGMLLLMTQNVTQTFSGEAQSHRKGYRQNLDIDLYFTSDLLEKQLHQDPAVKFYTSRVISGAMITSSHNVAAGLIYGVDAAGESKLGKTQQALIQGNYLTGSDHAASDILASDNITSDLITSDGEMLMGYAMAELLEADIGDRIVVSLSEVDTGELTQALFRISGIFKFGIREFDNNVAFVNINPFRSVLGLKANQSHEIAFSFIDPEDAKKPDLDIFKQLNKETIETLGWLELNKEISMIIEMSSYASLIVGIVLFSLTVLGVINSMFMSIYERIYEFGVFLAIGTRPVALALLILCEALLISLISCFFGMLLSFAIGSWTGVHGIPFGNVEFSGIAISSNILTQLHSSQFINFPLYVILLTLGAAIYPAIFAARIAPTEALQRSL